MPPAPSRRSSLYRPAISMPSTAIRVPRSVRSRSAAASTLVVFAGQPRASSALGARWCLPVLARRGAALARRRLVLLLLGLLFLLGLVLWLRLRLGLVDRRLRGP